MTRGSFTGRPSLSPSPAPVRRVRYSMESLASPSTPFHGPQGASSKATPSVPAAEEKGSDSPSALADVAQLLKACREERQSFEQSIFKND